MHTLNRYIGLILIILAIIYITAAFLLPSYAYVPVDANFLPLILGFLLLILSIILFFSKDPKDTSLSLKRSDFISLVVILAMILLYIFFLEILGFIIVTFAFLSLSSLYLGYRKHLVNLIVAILFPSIIYYLFSEVLMISLPSGILPF